VAASGASGLSPSDLAALLERQGAEFLGAPEGLAARLARVRALVFDWDGVFNRGEKAHDTASGFTESDSMGVNLLRYAFWRRDGRLPAVAIITGERNPSAQRFAEREHLDALYQGVKNKRQAMERFCASHALEVDRVACIFDDINDLAMAMDCGVRILVRRRASELLRGYVTREGRCDYVTASESGCYAVREAAELLMGLMGRFEEAVESRIAHDEDYRAYFSARQAISPELVEPTHDG
jgi:3-deoxy-D-manno-octulosonate 8-phosphate phosphatase (KDO 8-P phosphatase)